MSNSVLLQGDCLEMLKMLPENSVDSLITDPPAGISFMGKSWDEDKGGRKQWIKWMSDVMTECMRVLKPGAHGLVWAIPRTSHWTATALEDAGFEIRDVVTHLFGSGFPKSMDISKAIDKAAGAERTEGARCWTGGQRSSGILGHNHGTQTLVKFDTPSTTAAKKWQGWGTALKPASEYWILVRKPCSEKTVASNVLKHGCGGININASRVSTTEVKEKDSIRKPHDEFGTFCEDGGTPRSTGSGANHQQGRFPANLVFSHNDDCVESCTDGCPVAELDRQSGFSKSPGKTGRGAGGQNGAYSPLNAQGTVSCPSDSGGASRFFYVAKASKKDKGADNTHPTVKSQALMSYLIKMITPPGGVVLDCFLGSGSTGVAAIKNGFAFIGIEKELEYYEIADKRIQGATNGKRTTDSDQDPSAA